MSTTVVRVRRTVTAGGDPSLIFAIDGPPSDDQPLGLDPTLPPIDAMLQFESTPDADSDVISTAGKAIHARLATHGNLARALSDTLRTPNGQPSREIRIHIEPIAKAAHNLPWETLLHPDDGFVALSQDVPFSRAVPPVSADSLRSAATFDGTLKMVAVLAAAGIEGKPQWDAIELATRQWPAGQRDILLLVDLPAFKEAIELQIKNDGLTGYRVDLVPPTVEELVERIGDHAPHILQLFCHGQADGGGVLEIAMPSTAFGMPPLYLRPGQLASASRSSFLVLINACSGGAADLAADTNSIACALVEQGVPFVTCMRQRVEAKVLTLFVGALLRRVLRDLRADYAQGQRFTPQIATAVVAARRTIMESFGPQAILQRRFKEWTLPILCTSSAPFEIHPVKTISQEDGTQTLAAIRVLRTLLDTGTIEDAKRQAIEAHIVLLEQLLV